MNASDVPGGVKRSDLVEYAEALGRVLASHWPDATSIIWKGSAYKAWDGPYDFLPGLSDLDMHVYRSGGLDDPWQARRVIFDAVGEPPGNTPLQLLVLDIDATASPLWQSSYLVLFGGAPPGGFTTETELRTQDLEELLEAAGRARQIRDGVIDRSGAELWHYLRRVRWMFPPVLVRAATVLGHSPFEVWPMNRTALLELTAGDADLQDIRDATIRYYETALAAGLRPGDGDTSEKALHAGHDLLMIAADWADARTGTILAE